MKQIICEFGSAKAIAEFNTCLCTHIAVPVTLESDKDDETPGKHCERNADDRIRIVYNVLRTSFSSKK